MENRIRLDENNKLIVDAICKTDGTNHNLKIVGDYTISAKDIHKLLAGWNDKHIVRHSMGRCNDMICEIFTTSEDALKHFDERAEEWKKDAKETSEMIDAIRKLTRLIVDHNEKHHSGFFNKGSKIEIPDDVRAIVSKYMWE